MGELLCTLLYITDQSIIPLAHPLAIDDGVRIDLSLWTHLTVEATNTLLFFCLDSIGTLLSMNSKVKLYTDLINGMHVLP